MDTPPKEPAPPIPNERRQQAALVAVLGLVLVVLVVRAYLPVWFTRPLPNSIRTSVASLDINQATPAELQSLPGVGPELAAAIVAKRSNQPFGNVGELRTVPGIGPKTFDVLKSHVVVSEPMVDKQDQVEELKRKSSTQTENTTGKLNINTATAAELEKLPRIGPVLAEAIVATRRLKEFSSVDDLRRVRGIGAKTLEALRPFVITVP
jgi:competence protein ComEA